MKWCGRNVLVRRRTVCRSDAGSGAVQYGYADAGRANLQAGNVLFIAATADNYLRAYNRATVKNCGRVVYQRVVRLRQDL